MTPWNRSLPRRGFAASLALLLIPACGHPPETTKDSAAATPAAAAPARARRLAPVEVAAVASRRMTYSIDATGQLEPNEIVRVPSRVAGVLQDITFQEGTQVSPGTLLARVDPERYQLQTVRSEAALHQAEAQLKEAEAALRKRELLRAKDKGWVSDEELSNFGARGDEARATVAAAQAALDLARKDLKDSSVRSALKGVINKKLADTGQYLTAGQTIAEIVDVRRLKLSFKVAESESTRLTGTSSFSFTVKALPGQRFHARLYHIGEAADPLTRMVGCLAWVEEGTQAL